MLYTEKITLKQASDLQNKIEAGEMPDMSACYRIDNRDIPVPSISDEGKLDAYQGGDYYLTRSDYAQYIIGNQPLPEGYGYPNKELSSGIYDSLPEYYRLLKTGDWNRVNGICINSGMINDYDWHCFAFPLTDLARVEAETAEPERTEINIPQMGWLHYKTITLKYFKDNEPIEAEIWDGDIKDAKDGCKFEILTTTYNALPDEFKALAKRYVMPAHFETDWKAKYSELEADHNTLIKHLQEATASADSKQERINELEHLLENSNNKCILAAAQAINDNKRIKDLEHYKSISDDYVKALEGKLDAIELMKKADNELMKARADYFPY
jgi:hypothetical protein